MKCIFLGYLRRIKGYKLWYLEPRHKKGIFSRDVTFNEFEMANLTKRVSIDGNEQVARSEVDDKELQFEVKPALEAQEEVQEEVET